MLRAIVLFAAALPLYQAGSDVPGKKEPPALVQPSGAVTLSQEFRGKAGKPIALVAKANSPVRWVAVTPGIEFASLQDVKDHLKDQSTTFACASAPGRYAVMVVILGAAADGLPHEPVFTTVIVEAGK